MQRTDPLREAVSRFGAALKPKFSGIGAIGSPEDQLRGPLDVLVQEIVGALGWAANVVLIGESSVQDLKTRPDFAVTKQNLLVGFIELKAPGKGADPRRFDDPARQGAMAESSNRCPTSSTRTAIPSAFGRTAKLQGEIVTAGRARSKAPAPRCARRRAC